MEKPGYTRSRRESANRRSFPQKGFVAGAAAVGAGLPARPTPAFAQEGPEEKSGGLTPGDAALLRFAAAAEILETDFWVQCNELGGVPNRSEVPGGSGNPAYTWALQVLDMDMPPYIHDNTDDEFTHQNFLNAYLQSKAPMVTAVDPVTGVSVSFPNLTSAAEDLKANLIMPEPCPFISPNLPPCSVIRPTETKNIAKGVVKFLTDMGLFIGQSSAFFALLQDLAEDADKARRSS